MIQPQSAVPAARCTLDSADWIVPGDGRLRVGFLATAVPALIANVLMHPA
jgi:hypothetical protein